MAGDYTRFRYDPQSDATGILMQQGKVLIDQDWNESTLLNDRRWRTETTDIMGRAVVPIEMPTAFEIKIVGASLTIGKGRMYVDGLIAENHGAGPLEFDPVLGEVRGTLPVPYDKQPYFPDAPLLPADIAPHLVYLDVWQREVTYLEDLDLVDKAVGVDTATRLQTVWQVKVLADTPADTNCSTPTTSLAATAPSAGRLTNAAVGVPTSADPCIVPAGGGYRGAGNRLYRIEVHQGGPLGSAQFKWSRDNASVASAINGINFARDTVNVAMTKRDSALRFQPNDWVEVTDDFRYFNGLGGEMAQVSVVDDFNLTIQFKTALPAGAFDPTDPTRHTRVIRWDQSGLVFDSLGAVIVDVNANNGLIPIPAGGTAIVLEDGILLTFSMDASMPVQSFRPLEYWSFAARVIDASVETLTEAPPRGILHHYAWLGFVTFPDGVTSCRVFWPPNTGEGCDCTVCVSAISHNLGNFTLQSAVEEVKGKGGGKICLGPGVYDISDTVLVAGTGVIEFCGHGLPTLQATAELVAKPIMLIERSINITIQELSFAAGLGAANGFVTALELQQTFIVRVLRCAFSSGTDGQILADSRIMAPAIALGDLAVNTNINGNFFNNVSVGIGDVADAKTRTISSLSIESNRMVCIDAGVQLIIPVPTAYSEIRFACNFVQSAVGFLLLGNGLDVDIDSNSINLVPVPNPVGAPAGVGILSNLSQTRINNNRILGDNTTLGYNGIVLGPTAAMYGTYVTCNRISNVTGHGISIADGTLMLETIIADNLLLKIGLGGITMLSSDKTSSGAVDLTIKSNTLAFVAELADQDSNLFGMTLMTSSNVNVLDNIVENVGPDLGVAGIRIGILGNKISGLRLVGNRVVDIGPPITSTFSVGIYLADVSKRAEIINNDVRRATVLPAGQDSSIGSALLLIADQASVRGNLLESYGSLQVVSITSGGSLIFSENQIFSDSQIQVGTEIVTLQGNWVIASANFIKGPLAAPPKTAMAITASLNSAILGNIATGRITVNAAPLPANAVIPQNDLLNVAR